MNKQVIVTVSSPASDDLIKKLAFRHRGKYAVCPAGELVTPERMEMLHHSTVYTRKLERHLRKIGRGRLNCIVGLYGNRSLERREIEAIIAALKEAGIRRAVLLHFMRMRGAVTASGWLKDGNEFLAVDVLNIVGPGMVKMSVGLLWPVQQGERAHAEHGAIPPETEPSGQTWLDTRDRFSGFIGEGDIGLGEENVQKIANCEITVVGGGRTGDCALSHLVKFGAGRIAPLNIIDNDILVAANLDSMEVPYEAVGKHKAEVLAAKYSWLEPGLNVNPIPYSLSDREAVEAIIRSEIVFSCVDRNAARSGVSLPAQLYNRIHFDFAGGGVRTRGGHFSVAGEVRCALPGLSPCVWCMKENNWDWEIDQLDRPDEKELNDRISADWRGGDKEGSCKAVISSVVGNGMMLFIRLVQGKLIRSVHQHFDSNDLLPGWSDWSWRARRRRCRCCGKNGIAGLGDLGMKDEQWT